MNFESKKENFSGIFIEIRWHGRGGQGAVTASKLLSEAALSAGYYIQAFPEYGAERMGAPVKAFNRISSNRIDFHCQIKNPDIVVILDRTLLETIDVISGLKDRGSVILNTYKKSDELISSLCQDSKNLSLYTIDASKISLETIGKVIPNTPMVGALLKVMNFMDPKILEVTMKKTLSKKVSSLIINGNIAAAKRAYEEVEKSG